MIVGPLRNWLVAKAKTVLSERFTQARAREILERALLRYDNEVPSLSREENLGGRLMLHCAALTVAVYHELVEEGLGEAEARARTAQVTASIYDEMAEIPWLIARSTARSRIARLRRATRVFRLFPFGEPAYRMQDAPSDEHTIAFDVQRCPVAEYFRGRGLAKLCVESFCNLDYPLAARWGSRLDRTKTLAAGDDCCNFRWRVLSKDEGRTEQDTDNQK